MGLLLLCLVLMGALGLLLGGYSCLVGLFFVTATCGLGSFYGHPWLGLLLGLGLLWFLEGFGRSWLGLPPLPKAPPCPRNGCPYAPLPGCGAGPR